MRKASILEDSVLLHCLGQAGTCCASLLHSLGISWKGNGVNWRVDGYGHGGTPKMDIGTFSFAGFSRFPPGSHSDGIAEATAIWPNSSPHLLATTAAMRELDVSDVEKRLKAAGWEESQGLWGSHGFFIWSIV